MVFRHFRDSTLIAFESETPKELRRLSSVTLNCQVTKIVINSGSQVSELSNVTSHKDRLFCYGQNCQNYKKLSINKVPSVSE